MMMKDCKDYKVIRDYSRILEALRRISKKHNISFEQIIFLLSKCLR